MARGADLVESRADAGEVANAHRATNLHGLTALRPHTRPAGPRRRRTRHPPTATAAPAPPATAASVAKPRPPPLDLVLSSGFLAFAAHSGFLAAVEDAGLEVGGVAGTSAGALTGALWCAGHSAAACAAELSAVPPLARLRPCGTPWAGLMSLDAVIARLRDLLPPTFEDLDREFACCVVGRDGQHHLISSGPLPEAVAASAAIPALFAPVVIPGREAQGPFKDGGVVDRTGLVAWRDRRRSAAGGDTAPSPPPPALVHLIGRSSAFSGADDVSAMGEKRVVLVRSPKSRASLVSLRDFEFQVASARSRARPAVRAAIEGRWSF